MEEQHQQNVTAPTPANPAGSPPANVTAPAGTVGGGKSNKKWIIIAAMLVLLIAAGVAAFLLLGKKDDSKGPENQPAQSQQAANENEESTGGEAVEPIDCEDGYTGFASAEFGAAFCYPNEWGTASVKDAKLADEDTGYRQIVAFSRNPQFVVGGVSDDWTTAVGRGGSCLEPSNTPLDASAYNEEWHDITEDFAKRSLETSIGGYDMTETVGSFLGGLCAVGHKVINGSRYRVVSVSYFNAFTSSVTSAADHMEDPYVLFRETERFNLDKILATLEAR